MTDRHEASPAINLQTGKRLRLITLLIFLGLSSLCVVAILLIEKHSVSEKRIQAANLAQTHLRGLSTNINQALSATYALSALVIQGNGEVSDFEKIAGEMLPLYPGVGALQLAPSGIIRQTVPLAGNEKAIGHDLLKDPARTKEAFLARTTGKLTLAGPFKLVQGGLGAVGRLPVFLTDSTGEKRFWGFTAVLIRFPEILEAAGLPDIAKSGYNYELWRIHPDSGKKQIISSSLETPLENPVEIPLALPNGEWTLGVRPAAGWHNTVSIVVSGLIGLFISLLCAFMLYMLLRQPVKLRQEVAERTRELLENQAILNESEQKFRLAFENANTGMCLVDMSGNLVRVNNKMAEIFGYAKNELEQMTVNSLAVPEDRELSGNYMNKALASEQGAAAFEKRYYHKDGHVVWGQVASSLVRNAAGEPDYFISQIQDITIRKQMEDERITMERQLLHSQKLESLGVLAGGIAHDFNNILTSVIGNADLALMRMDAQSPAADNLRRIVQASERATDLARQMLAYSGRGRFVIGAIELNQLVEEMAHMLEVSISKKARLQLDLARPLPLVEADATQLNQVIMNMVINASEAIGDQSGVIIITTGCMDCDSGYLKEAWMNEPLPGGHYVYLEVSDNGCGMDHETMSKIFDPFFTTKFTGRGLGMAAVLGIVRGHKGTIKVYSEPGQGTSFKVFLPASASQSQPGDSNAGDRRLSGWKGSGTVLLVDDEESILKTGGEMLRELGFEVITACDGREALNVFQANRQKINCTILDLTMPDLDGAQTFQELCRLDPEVQVVMSSAYNRQEIVKKFAGKRLAGFIQKPYRLSELAEVLQKISG